MHQNDRINEFYENHEHTYRFDENILSTKQYKTQKVAKTGKKKQKMPKFTKNPYSFAYHMQKNGSIFINDLPK